MIGKKSVNPIVIIGALFFVFGFVTWLNSVLIPYLKIACELTNFESYLVAFAFYIAYFVMALPSAWILKKTGFKKGMAIGLVIMALGALLFIPAALTRTYAIFLIGLFIQGTGLAVLQTASNPYITILGPVESAAKRISIMGICNKVAGSIAPLVLGAVTLSDADIIQQRILSMTAVEKAGELDLLASRVILPYVAIIVVLIVLAFLTAKSDLPEIDTDKEESSVAQSNTGKTSIMQFPHVLLGAFTLFLYVGVEVMAGDTVISYAISRGISTDDATNFTSVTLVCMIIGYLVGIACIPKYFSQQTALKASAMLGVVFAVLAIFIDSTWSVWFISLLGLANSLMWPAIWPLAINGLGRFTKTGASLLIMGISGGALLPLIYGYLADTTNTQQAYWIMVPCYLFIWYFAVYGHKVGLKIKG